MKIILLQDVPEIGKKYDVKNVASGYARNFLIPRRLAELATSALIKSAEIKKKQAGQKKEIHKDILSKNIESLENLRVSIEEKANEKGHLFAGIHKEEISKILKEQKHLDIPPEFIELEHPIKEIGEHKIPVRLPDGKAKNQEFVLEVGAKK